MEMTCITFWRRGKVYQKVQGCITYFVKTFAIFILFPLFLFPPDKTVVTKHCVSETISKLILTDPKEFVFKFGNAYMALQEVIQEPIGQNICSEH